VDKFSSAHASRIASHIFSHRVTEDPALLGRALDVMKRHPELGATFFPQAGTESPVFKRVLNFRILAGMMDLLSDQKIRTAIAKNITDPLWRRWLR
jgi:hypothetical protein